MPDYDFTERALMMFSEANYTTTPVRFEGNPRWVKPDTGEWIEMFIQHGGGQNISVGNVNGGGGLLTRYAGNLMAHVYTPDNIGTRRIAEIAKAWAQVWQNIVVSDLNVTVTMREAQIMASTSPNAGFRRWIVNIPWQRDEKT